MFPTQNMHSVTKIGLTVLWVYIFTNANNYGGTLYVSKISLPLKYQNYEN